MKVLFPEAGVCFERRVGCDVMDPRLVFGELFDEMPDDVAIRPSENCLYFSFSTKDEEAYRGCIKVPARLPSSGMVSIFYRHKEDANRAHVGKLGANEGVSLQRVTPLSYVATVNQKSVEFHFQELRLSKPTRCKLRVSELFVAPCFDESGIYFSLLFDTDTNCFLWIVNDDYPTHDEFTEIFPNIEIGCRSRFVVLNDRRNSRRVLVGVSKAEVKANSYYDGPFDQLPDNYIETGDVEIQKFIHLNNPDRIGMVDCFGFFKMLRASRVAIIPYYIYDDFAIFDKLSDAYRNESESLFFSQFLKGVNRF